MPRLSKEELAVTNRQELYRESLRNRMRNFRARAGARYMNVIMSPDVAIGLIYLRQQWGMKSNKEAMEAAVRFLTICTRSGLQVLPQSIDD